MAHVLKLVDLLYSKEEALIELNGRYGINMGDYNNAKKKFRRLNKVLKELLKKAIDRAKENKREIVISCDL